MEKQKTNNKLTGISVVLPAYNDAASLEQIIPELLCLLPTVASDFEIIIVNDASKDNTQKVIERFGKKSHVIKIITHKVNQGYGAALLDGFSHAKKDFIFYTDSDGQYDVTELPKLVNLMDEETDIVTGFKKERSDSLERKLIGALYNTMVKFLLDLHIKDIDCDFRLFRRQLLNNLTFVVRSGGFDASFIKSLEKNNARFKEVRVHHYPRKFGSSQFFTPQRVIKSLLDVGKVWYYTVFHV